MKLNDLLSLELNHIGIVIDKTNKNKFSNNFVFDPIQGVHILFEYSKIKNCYVEYITNEGRAKNYKLGFNHLCYNLKDNNELNKIHKYILENNLGFRITFPEESISKFCNYVTFYKLNFFDIIEFNIKSFK